MRTRLQHGNRCAYAGLPINERPELPWPASPNTDMCVCDNQPPTDFPVTGYLRDNSDVEFEYVALGGTRRDGDPPRWFIADQRDFGGTKGMHVCIHQWTSSPASLLRNLRWAAQYPKPWAKLWVFEARNKGQIAAWLQEFGYNPDYMGKKRQYTPAQERQIVSTRDRHIEAAQHTIARAQAKIDRLMSLPNEPSTEDPDGALVVWFRRRFAIRGQEYTYAAVKASDGLWYTTGPASPKGYSWDELVQWLYDEKNEDAVMWVAAEWTPVV